MKRICILFFATALLFGCKKKELTDTDSPYWSVTMQYDGQVKKHEVSLLVLHNNRVMADVVLEKATVDTVRTWSKQLQVLPGDSVEFIMNTTAAVNYTDMQMLLQGKFRVIPHYRVAIANSKCIKMKLVMPAKHPLYFSNGI